MSEPTNTRFEEPNITLFRLMAFAEWVEETLQSPDGISFEAFCLARGSIHTSKITKIIDDLENRAGDLLVMRRLGPKGAPEISTRAQLEGRSGYQRSNSPTQLGKIWAGYGAVSRLQWDMLEDPVFARESGIYYLLRRHWRELENYRREIEIMSEAENEATPDRPIPF